MSLGFLLGFNWRWKALAFVDFIYFILSVKEQGKTEDTGEEHGHAHNKQPFTCGTVLNVHMQIGRMQLYMQRGPSLQECGSGRSAPTTRLLE